MSELIDPQLGMRKSLEDFDDLAPQIRNSDVELAKAYAAAAQAFATAAIVHAIRDLTAAIRETGSTP